MLLVDLYINQQNICQGEAQRFKFQVKAVLLFPAKM
jgi:hypothetical protein